MSNVQGRVSAVSQRGKAFNVQIDGTDWYGCGFVSSVPFSKGDVISFSWSENKGFKNIDMKSVQVVKGASTQTAGSSAASAQGAPKRDSADWARKDAQDAARQAAITVQACRNSAIELVKVLKEVDALPLGSKKQDIAGNLIAFVDDLTEQWVQHTKTVAAGGVPEPVVKEEETF